MTTTYPGYLRKPHYYETDQMGIIHHSNYIRWFEEARVDVLEHLGLSYHAIENAGIIIPVLAVDCQYKNMIRYGDQVKILVIITQYTGTRLDFSYEIRDIATDQLMTTGASKHCFLSKDSGRLLSLKKTHPAFHQIFVDFSESL